HGWVETYGVADEPPQARLPAERAPEHGEERVAIRPDLMLPGHDRRQDQFDQCTVDRGRDQGQRGVDLRQVVPQVTPRLTGELTVSGLRRTVEGSLLLQPAHLHQSA